MSADPKQTTTPRVRWNDAGGQFPFEAGIEAVKNGLTRRSRPRDLIPADQLSWDNGFNWQKRQEQTHAR